MATSNNVHQLSHSHPIAPHTVTTDYLRSSLVQPPFGYILQLTPQTAFLISTNTNHNSNISYEVYRLCRGMPGDYHLVGYSRVTNFEPEQVGRDAMQVMILELRPVDRGDSGMLDVANADFEVTGALMVPLDLDMTPPVEPLDLDMTPPVEPLDLNMPPPIEPLDLNMPPPVQPFDLNMPPMEEDDEQHTDRPSLVHHPEEEVVRTGITLDSVLNILISYHDPDIYEEYLELQEQTGRVDSGLSEETIMQHIKITCYTATTRSPSEEPDICVICQGEFENAESIGGLQCGHQYHVECIAKWLQRTNKCPICKATAVVI